jgi:hypothetical protein
LERKFQRVLDVLKELRPKTPNLTYYEMLNLIGKEGYFLARRDSWPKDIYLKHVSEHRLAKYNVSTFEGYFPSAEDVEAKDWTIYKDVPSRP